MLGLSSWAWLWMGVLAPGLWFARAVIWAFLVDRITRNAIEKADAKDLPQVLAGLGALTGVILAAARPRADVVSLESRKDGGRCAKEARFSDAHIGPDTGEN